MMQLNESSKVWWGKESELMISLWGSFQGRRKEASSVCHDWFQGFDMSELVSNLFKWYFLNALPSFRFNYFLIRWTKWPIRVRGSERPSSLRSPESRGFLRRWKRQKNRSSSIQIGKQTDFAMNELVTQSAEETVKNWNLCLAYGEKRLRNLRDHGAILRPWMELSSSVHCR